MIALNQSSGSVLDFQITSNNQTLSLNRMDKCKQIKLEITLLQLQQQNIQHMSGKQVPHPSKRMTLEELQGSASVQKNNGNMGYSAFSTATHKDHLAYTHEKTNDGQHFPNYYLASPLQKYKISLKLFGKQQQPIFKQTNYIIPNLEQDDNQAKKQKENNKGFSNKLNIEQVNVGRKEVGKEIPWKSATKSETAEIVRSLFGEPKIDYNFEYRKKKFFLNFSRQP